MMLKLNRSRGGAQPATTDMTLGDYYSAAIIMGVMASQPDDLDQDWAMGATDFALNMGEQMARKALARRKKTR